MEEDAHARDGHETVMEGQIAFTRRKVIHECDCRASLVAGAQVSARLQAVCRMCGLQHAAKSIFIVPVSSPFTAIASVRAARRIA